MNEARAIELCIKHHDPAGFEYLFNQFRREAYYHAVSFLNNHDDAVDACQECFTKAYAAMPRLEKLSKFYPWFYSILRNHCMNILKKHSVARRYVEGEAQVSDSQAETLTPDFLAEKGEEQLKTWNTLERLTIDFREILVMKYIEGRKYEEISEILGIPRGTVMSRLYHARKAFRTEYINADTKRR